MIASDFRELWFRNLVTATRLPLDKSISARGQYDKHTGPGWASAAVLIAVSPGSSFSVRNNVALTEERSSLGFPDFVIFGFLDVMLVADNVDTNSIILTIDDVCIDPITTTPMALREAGRDAARKILETIRARRAN
jgi:hypothetical protein